MRQFLRKKILFWFYCSSLPFSKILVTLLVAFAALVKFFKRLHGPHTKLAKKRCRPYTFLFSDLTLFLDVFHAKRLKQRLICSHIKYQFNVR